VSGACCPACGRPLETGPEPRFRIVYQVIPIEPDRPEPEPESEGGPEQGPDPWGEACT
jgi:hypothetical protein